MNSIPSATITLGSTDLQIPRLGIGVWAWGARGYWGYGSDYGKPDVEAAFKASLAAGVNFFDTAELYGSGRSERLLGEFAQATNDTVITATKFMPLPWRLGKATLCRALRRSLKRLGMDSVALYQIHWPMPPVSIETWMAALADAVEEGLVQTVGVSNYDAQQTRRAHQALERRNVPLASNQINYSLLRRGAEFNGLLATCKELEVTVIAYSPLAQGMLTGKYTLQHAMSGIRARRFSKSLPGRMQPLIGLLREIGQEHGGKSPSQVALNWTIYKGTVPIPGVKNVAQTEDNVGALGWLLAADEVAALDKASHDVRM